MSLRFVALGQEDTPWASIHQPGRHPDREVQTGIGSILVRILRDGDRTPDAPEGASSSVPGSCRLTCDGPARRTECCPSCT